MGWPLSTTLDGRSTGSRSSSGRRRSWPTIVKPVTGAIAPTGRVWICYPKGSSKIQTDLTRDKGWQPLDGSDLMWLSLVSIDETWSAFGLRPVQAGRGPPDLPLKAGGPLPPVPRRDGRRSRLGDRAGERP